MWNEIASAIEQRMNTEWALLYPTIPVIYDNTDTEVSAGETHLELTILDADAKRMDIGDSYRLHRAYGIINVNIYVTTGVGTRTARGYADSVAGIFRDQMFSSVLCRSPVLRRIGEVGEFFQYNVSIDFQYDEAYT